ncbi:hypothetical protein JOF56_002313 [Kibdelosporangium banguiense]|uniref:DUF6802 domain-containing protein n=1 Tax=Kibdelosporangium banguiense TaxID=1365924 RepID=A0ABS4TBY5_9PSEU|nr:DUF6802 family protein [Kibdelosporangium banguiense]MBP2321928.1 hypothetical protein [Kibdelosporangium banguiense]
MYDDTDQDASTGTAHNDEMTVNVDGEQYSLATEYDVNKDGVNDTAIVQTDDGGQVAYTDSDNDGAADTSIELDDQGNVVGAARYDEGRGEWIPVDPRTGNPADSSTAQNTGNETTSSNQEVMVDVPEESEDMSAGTATADMDHDGRNDTAVVQSEDGDLFAFTDTDGDGDADQMTVIESDGNVTISQHTGEDEWAEVERGHLDAQGNYVPDNQRA